MGAVEAVGSGIPIFPSAHQKLVRTVKMHEGNPQESGLGTPEEEAGGESLPLRVGYRNNCQLQTQR